jgi:hypothetical protein
VEYCHTSLETKKGVVIKHFTDKHQTLVVDLISRKRYTVSIETKNFCYDKLEISVIMKPSYESKSKNFFDDKHEIFDYFHIHSISTHLL